MRYRVQGFFSGVGLQSSERFANDENEIRADLERVGATLVSAQIMHEPARASSQSRFPYLIFCQQLLSLLEAGLGLVEAIETLTMKEGEQGHPQVLEQLQSDLRAGLSFSQALQLHPSIFPPLFQAAIEASEQTGSVAEALKRFIAYETQFQTLRNRVVSALIYPALLLSLGSLVTAFLLGYVVPRFSVVFVDRLNEMPYFSQLVIRLGLGISENPVIALLAAACTAALLSFAMIHPTSRGWIGNAALQIPWLGKRVREFELVRIYRALGMLLRGGIPAVRSLQMVCALAPVRSHPGLDRAIASVSEGMPISTALKTQGFTTVVSDRLLGVGERSGQMGEMLDRSANFMDAELERSIDRAVRLMEPLMMAVIGIVIGGIVMLMYLPIFELADSVR